MSPQQVASLYADIGAKTDGFERGAATIRGGLGSLSTLMVGVTIAATAMAAAFEFSKEAAQMQRLVDSGSELARQMGSNMDEIVAKVKAASLGTVSEMDIIASSNKAMMLGVTADADQLANLMEVAAFRGRAMGLSTTQAFDDIVRGIGRSSPLILDNLGIVISAKQRYADYAESIGKSAGELTKSEKTQALLNAVLDEGNAMLAKSGGLAEDSASGYERLNAELANTKKFFMGSTFGLERLADMGSGLLVSFRDLAENGLGYGGEKLNAFSLFINFAESRVKAMNDEINKTGAAVTGSGDMFDDYRESIDDTKLSMEELDKIEKNYQENNANMINDAMATQKAWDDEGAKLEDIKGKIVELEEQKAKLYPWETEKIQEINDKIEDQKNAYNESRDAFIQASEEKIAQAALEKIAMMDGIEGYSEAEAEMARQVLENMGLASSAALEQQVAIDLLNNALVSGAIPSAQQYGAVLKQVMSDGVMSIDEVNRAIAALPSNKTINVDVTTSGATGLLDMSFSSSGRTTPLGSGDEGASRRRKMKNHAMGGQFLIPASYGYEGFRLGNGDTASGGESITIGKGGNSDVISAIMATRLDEYKLGMIIRDAMLQASR